MLCDSESCKQLLDLASAGTIVLGLPLVALIEPLDEWHLNVKADNATAIRLTVSDCRSR